MKFKPIRPHGVGAAPLLGGITVGYSMKARRGGHSHPPLRTITKHSGQGVRRRPNSCAHHTRFKVRRKNSFHRETITMGTFFCKTEHSHYDLMEVLSALQKAIRRGEEFPAMYWADECCPKFSKALWRRLVIISHEDIGLADPKVPLFTAMAKEQWEDLIRDEKTGSARLILGNTILLLARAPKSRLADHFQTALRGFREIDEGRLEIPDYALDKHTAKGTTMGRGWVHFQKEGALLHNKVPLPHDAEYEKDFFRFKPLLEKKQSAPPEDLPQGELFERHSSEETLRNEQPGDG